MQSNSVEAETSTLHVGWSLFPSKPSTKPGPNICLRWRSHSPIHIATAIGAFLCFSKGTGKLERTNDKHKYWTVLRLFYVIFICFLYLLKILQIKSTTTLGIEVLLSINIDIW